jgi:hypothetical protein
MSSFDNAMRSHGSKPVGKKVEFYVDCQYCDEEVSEVDYYPNEKAMVYTCVNDHRNVIEGINLSL